MSISSIAFGYAFLCRTIYIEGEANVDEDKLLESETPKKARRRSGAASPSSGGIRIIDPSSSPTPILPEEPIPNRCRTKVELNVERYCPLCRFTFVQSVIDGALMELPRWYLVRFQLNDHHHDREWTLKQCAPVKGKTTSVSHNEDQRQTNNRVCCTSQRHWTCNPLCFGEVVV